MTRAHQTFYALASFAAALAGCASAPTPPPAAPSAPPPVAAAPPAPAPKPPEVDPWAGRTDLYQVPQLTPSTKVDLGKVDRFTLPNGLQVLVVPRPSLPSVDVTVAVRAGGNEDPIEQAGLSQFVASMLRKGTRTRSADQISDAVDFVGAELEASAGEDATTIGCHARSKDLALCLDLTAEVAARPTFPEKEMGEIRDQLNASVESVRDNPGSLGRQHAANLFFGDDDPRGRPVSKRSVASIDRAALVKFHDTWYAPNNALLAVSGDVDAKQLRKLLARAFGGWKKHAVPKRVERGLPAARPLQVRLVDKPDATQSTILLVGPGIAHAAPDFYATALMNYTLGGGMFSSRLMKVVRSEGGKTYGIGSRFSLGRDPGEFTVSTFTRNGETTPTIKLILDEIGKMRAGGPTDVELAAAKGHLIGGYGLRLETPSDIAGALLAAELDGLDAHYVEQYPQRMSAVTLQEAAKAGAAHLAPVGLVVVGKAEEVKPLLAQAGYAVTDVVAYTDPVSPAERRALAEEKEKAKAQPVTAADADLGHKLLDAAIAAKGGRGALAALKALVYHGKGTMVMQGQSVPIALDQWVVPGRGNREELTVGPLKIVKVVADGKGYMKQGDKVMDMPPPVADKAMKGMWRQADLILMHAASPEVKVRGLPQATDGGIAYDVLEVVAPDGEATRLWLDAKTHLIARLTYTADEMPAREEFADYATQGGIQVARTARVEVGDAVKIDVKFESVEVNPKLAPTLFDK